MPTPLGTVTADRDGAIGSFRSKQRQRQVLPVPRSEVWVDKDEVVPDDGDAEDQSVDAVEHAAVARQEAARILDASRALAGGFEEIAHLPGNVAEDRHRQEMRKRNRETKVEGVGDGE